jgi:hypothetical protein
MRYLSLPVASVAVVLCAVAISAGQSLADVARAEAARRQALGNIGAKVYTNDGLSDRRRASPGEVPPATTPVEARSGMVSSQPESGPGSIEPPKDEKYWRSRITEARASLRKSQAFFEALQSHINGLYAEFTAMSDPVQRSAIEKKRNDAIAEQNRLKAEIARQTKEIAAIEEEARRASVPAGWLR